MEEGSNKLRQIASVVGRLAFFVFLILGVPLILLLPTAGVKFPSFLRPFNHVAAVVFYGVLAAFGGLLGILLTYAIVVVVYRHLAGKAADTESPRLSPLALIWWCWGALLSWWMFVHFGREMLAAWSGGG